MPIQEMDFVGAPISEADLVEAEAALGVTLPADYRAFLLRYNGGRPTPETFYFEREQPGSLLNIFFRVNDKESMFDLVSRGKGWRGRVPQDLLVIGNDAGGSLICIGVHGKRRGKVYFWSLEDESDPRDPTNYQNVWLCADSFDEFIAGLHETSP